MRMAFAPNNFEADSRVSLHHYYEGGQSSKKTHKYVVKCYPSRPLWELKFFFFLFVQIAVFGAQYAAEVHPEERFEIFLPSVKQSSKINST